MSIVPGNSFMKLIALACALSFCPPAFSQPQVIYTDPSAPAEARITDLLSRMTIEEKIDALGTNPTVARLGVAATGHVE